MRWLEKPRHYNVPMKIRIIDSKGIREEMVTVGMYLKPSELRKKLDEAREIEER